MAAGDSDAAGDVGAHRTASDAGKTAASGAARVVTVLNQNFAKLSDAIEEEVWEVDGDDVELYECDGSTPGDGPTGALFQTAGGTASSAQLVHQLKSEESAAGARVSRILATLHVEELDPETSASFAIGLAFNEDLEESSLLAVTVRRPRQDPDEAEEAELDKGNELHLNGVIATTELGKRLPLRFDLDITLTWGSSGADRRVTLRHLVTTVGDDRRTVSTGETSTTFYTSGTHFGQASALYLKSTGIVKVRLINIECHAEISSDLKAKQEAALEAAAAIFSAATEGS